MPRRAWPMRFTPLLAVVALAAAACGGSSDPPPSTASGQSSSAAAAAGSECPFPGASAAATTTTDRPGNSNEIMVTPLKLARSGEQPADGVYRTGDGREVKIPHTPVVCGEPFVERIDLTRLGPWDTCVDGSNDPTVQRPCHWVFKAGPDTRAQTLSGTWMPIEGTDELRIVCQVTSNVVILQGLQQDNGSSPIWKSNVWNKVEDPRIQPGGVGWFNDVWSGNAGYRGPLCPASDRGSIVQPSG